MRRPKFCNYSTTTPPALPPPSPPSPTTTPPRPTPSNKDNKDNKKPTTSSSTIYLCGESMAEVPKRFDCIVRIRNNNGRRSYITCQDLYWNRNDMYSNTMLLQYRNTCCDNTEPKPNDPNTCLNIEEDEGGSGGGDEKGTEPVCHLCGSSQKFPSKPNVYINARYIGSYTCEQLYYRGKNQLIPGFLCTPLQHYAYTVCGC